MMLSHLAYLEYCHKNKFTVNVQDLDKNVVYYWHSCFNSNVVAVKYLKLNGNTFIFQIEKGNKLALSAENGVIYGLAKNKTINFFEHWKYQD
jgi:hypothetical protein